MPTTASLPLELRCCWHIAPWHFHDTTITSVGVWATRLGHLAFRRNRWGWSQREDAGAREAGAAAQDLANFVRYAAEHDWGWDTLRKECCRFLAPWPEEEEPASLEDWCETHGRAAFLIARGDWTMHGRSTAAGPPIPLRDYDGRHIFDAPGAQTCEFAPEDASYIAHQEARRLTQFVARETERLRNEQRALRGHSSQRAQTRNLRGQLPLLPFNSTAQTACGATASP